MQHGRKRDQRGELPGKYLPRIRAGGAACEVESATIPDAAFFIELRSAKGFRHRFSLPLEETDSRRVACNAGNERTGQAFSRRSRSTQRDGVDQHRRTKSAQGFRK